MFFCKVPNGARGNKEQNLFAFGTMVDLTVVQSPLPTLIRHITDCPKEGLKVDNEHVIVPTKAFRETLEDILDKQGKLKFHCKFHFISFA